LAAASLGRTSEEYPVEFDPHKGLAEMDKYGDVENVVGIEIQVLDAVVPE
jgi:hypothetical protein